MFSLKKTQKAEKTKQADKAKLAATKGGQNSELEQAEVDFFGSMGKEREKDGKLKPDPEKVKVSEKEYNPFLRGEESNLPVPESASASSIPKDLCVGAAWAGKNDWRKRAQRRQAADNERDEPRKQAASPSRSRAKREVPKGDELRGPTGGGWRAKKAKLSDGVLLPDQWLQPPHDAGEKGNAFTLPPPDPEQNVKVLEEVDAAGRSKKLLGTVQSTSVHTKGRNKRGNANAVPAGKDKKGSQGYYEDDDVSLTELLRRERVEGVQDYDSNFGKHILKRGDKFKMLDEDEDEAYALGWYENKDKKMDERKGAEKRLQQEKNDKNRVQVNLERCAFCMDSKKFFRKGAIMSVSPHAYLCVEAQNRCVVPGQVVIVPQEHAMAMTDVDEAALVDIRNYQKCLISFFESEQPPRAVLFVESSVHRVSRDKALLGAGPHCCITAYPIEMELLVQARTYWKKAFDEAENEFETSHKKVIDTDSKGGVRTAVPKGFPYIHVDFSLGGGFAHVVDNVVDFPKDFVQHVMAGMCELTILDRAYTCKEEYRDACTDLKERFAKDFDWTQALQS